MEEQHRSPCPAVREGLSAYLEQELSGEDLARVENHLAGCLSCRADLELLRHTVGALRGLPEVPPPAAILRGVREEMAPRGPGRRLARLLGGRPSLGIPLGAAATLVAAFGVFLLVERFPDLGTHSPPELSTEAVRPAAPLKGEPPPLPLSREEEEAGERGEVAPPLSAPDGGVTGVAVRIGDDIVLEETVSPAPLQPEEVTGRRSLPPAALVEAERMDKDLSDLSVGDGAGGQSLRETPPRAPPGDIREKPSPESASVPAAPPGEEKAALPREEMGEPAAAAAGMKKESPAFFDEAFRKAPPPEAMKKKAKKAVPRENVEIGETGVLGTSYRKSLPPRESAPMRQYAVPRAAAPLPGGPSAEGGDDAGPEGREDRELLTIVSFGDDEVQLLRESLEQTGGTLLEMRNLDTVTSRQVALPHQDLLPPSQVISRGWQVKALLPRSRAEEFVTTLEGQSEFQLLERVSAASPAAGREGTQLFEIKLIR